MDLLKQAFDRVEIIKIYGLSSYSSIKTWGEFYALVKKTCTEKISTEKIETSLQFSENNFVLEYDSMKIKFDGLRSIFLASYVGHDEPKPRIVERCKKYENNIETAVENLRKELKIAPNEIAEIRGGRIWNLRISKDKLKNVMKSLKKKIKIPNLVNIPYPNENKQCAIIGENEERLVIVRKDAFPHLLRYIHAFEALNSSINFINDAENYCFPLLDELGTKLSDVENIIQNSNKFLCTLSFRSRALPSINQQLTEAERFSLESKKVISRCKDFSESLTKSPFYSNPPFKNITIPKALREDINPKITFYYDKILEGLNHLNTYRDRLVELIDSRFSTFSTDIAVGTTIWIGALALLPSQLLELSHRLFLAVLPILLVGIIWLYGSHFFKRRLFEMIASFKTPTQHSAVITAMRGTGKFPKGALKMEGIFRDIKSGTFASIMTAEEEHYYEQFFKPR